MLAADRNLSSLAASLSRAGVSGTTDQLRAQVYLALLTGQPVTAPAECGERPAEGCPGTRSGASGHGPGACTSGLYGSVNLTVPLATWLGLSDAPGHAAGYGPLDAGDSRDLAAMLARHPGSRWCVTVTGTGGRPTAHGCARAGPGSSGGSRPPPRRAGRNAAAPGRGAAVPGIMGWLAGIAISKLEMGDCSHLRESPAYRPPPSLRHLITIRQPVCSFPGCRRPAIRGDQDHTIPYRGGRTCECNLAPLCRRHHRAKQSRGWKLAQPEPGMMAWTTPSGRTYATGPAAYPR